MTILLCILLALGGVSIYLAYSGYIPGHTDLGWAFLGVYLIVYLMFAIAWVSTITGPFSSMFAVVGLALLLALEAPLVVELVSQSVMPDPSKGLKLIEVHTEAERKVAEDDLPGAIAEYEKVIAENPVDVVARFRLAELCYEDHKYHKAVTAYEALLSYTQKLDISQHCSALTRLSEIYAQRLGDVESARRHIQTIIETYPDSKYASYARARLDNL